MNLPDYVRDRYWVKSYPPGFSWEVSVPPVSPPRLVEEGMENNPDRVAMVYFGREMRYSELQRMIDRVSSALYGWGVRKGETVAYKYPRFLEFRKEIPKSAVGKILRRVLRDEEMKRKNS